MPTNIPSFHDPLLDARPVATLDLHGFSRAEAKGALVRFVATWRKRASGHVVHVVTGKGRGSGGRSALKPAIRKALQTELAHEITEWARDLDDGGYLVLLR